MSEVKGISVSKDTIDALKQGMFANITVRPDADFKEGEQIAVVGTYDTLICIINEIYVDEVMHITLEMSWEELNEYSFD